jgi:hypothetical protein
MELVVEPGVENDISWENDPFFASWASEWFIKSLRSNTRINSCVFGIIASSANRLSILFGRKQFLINCPFERPYSPFVTVIDVRLDHSYIC